MLAILPMLLTLVPDLMKWIAGDTAGNVATRVSDVVASIAGDTTPAALSAVLADPAKSTDLRLALAKIALDAEESKRQTDLAELTTRMADVANARQATLDLTKTGSLMGFGAPIISFIVLATLGVLAAIVVWRPLPTGSETLVSALLETFKVLAVSVVGYWVGSSAGSARKDVTIAAVAAGPLAPGVAQ